MRCSVDTHPRSAFDPAATLKLPTDGNTEVRQSQGEIVQSLNLSPSKEG